jgi:hypothetical protein
MQSAFMTNQQEGLQAIQDIRRIMERSSRFISLSGWSGIAAGLCALAGAAVANYRINLYKQVENSSGDACPRCLVRDLFYIAIVVFISALLLAILFTWLRSKKDGIPLWGISARRLIWNTFLPLATGGLVVLKFQQLGYYELVVPACLVFYGLALINGSKFTIGEVRFLGYLMLAAGLVNLWMPTYGLFFWALGFGVFHIFYGVMMWWKYERNEGKDNL